MPLDHLIGLAIKQLGFIQLDFTKVANLPNFFGCLLKVFSHSAMALLSLPNVSNLMKTQTDWLQTSPMFADHCFNAFNLKKYAAGPEPLEAQCLPTTDLSEKCWRLQKQKTAAFVNIDFNQHQY